MYKIKVTNIGIVNQLNTRTDLTYCTDSQDVEHIKYILAGNNKEAKKELEDFNAFFVGIGDGEYTEIYAITSNTAWLNQPLYKVEIVPQ